MKHETNSYIVEGEVAPGYESVKDLFISKFEIGCEENSQLCVYVKGEKVIDLWGRVDKQNKFDGDSLVNVFSSTKSVTAICMGMAYERGWLNYQDKICKHWPEFAQKGKEEIRIVDLLKHEAGMAQLEYPLEMEDSLTHNIKNNVMGEKLAGMSPAWPEGSKREYHAITRGWLANEIFRRVHPDSLTIGEFLEKEISFKLDIDVYIGCEKENFYGFKHAPGGYNMIHSLRNSFGLSSGVNYGFFEIVSMIWKFRNIMKNSKPNLKNNDIMVYNLPEYRKGQYPSVNGNCSARGLAKLAAYMANKGTGPDGKVLMNNNTWEAMHADSTKEVLLLDIMSAFTQGGLGNYEDKEERSGYFGWMGYGGSVFQWHPQLCIGFSYTCTLLFPMNIQNYKAAEIQREVVKCARNLAGS